jgi:hypothetical protein
LTVAAPLPFQRVAILQPDLTFSSPQRTFFTDKDEAELTAWLHAVSRAGADAVYARIHHELPPFALKLLKRLEEPGELFLIAPVSHWDANRLPGAWHLRARDAGDLVPTGAFLSGRSCHSLEDVISAQNEGLDYVFLSPVFSTRTHPEAAPLGLEKLRAVCAQVDIPVIALGGIDQSREKACLQAGASGIAGIRMFLS